MVRQSEAIGRAVSVWQSLKKNFDDLIKFYLEYFLAYLGLFLVDKNIIKKLDLRSVI